MPCISATFNLSALMPVASMALGTRVHCRTTRSWFSVSNPTQRRDIASLVGGLNNLNSAQLRHACRARDRLACRAAAEPDGQSTNASGPPALPSNSNVPAFNSLERLVADRTVGQSGLRSDWLLLEGCWVLQPPARAERPKAVAMFCGGAFAGAAPQLTYRLLLECLTNRNILVVAVPFSTGFNHMQIADECAYKFDRCMQALSRQPGTSDVNSLPVYGVGHSLGSLIQLLISTRYPSQRAGNALMSFNNKPLDDVPLLAPFLGPASRVVAPFLNQLATSPARSALINALEGLRRTSPALVQQLFPVLDQLEPIYMDLANGVQQFTPSPEETRQNLRSNYGVPRNLIIQFRDDTLDESPLLNSILQSNSAAARLLVYRTLPGDHTRPLLQTVGDVPPEVQDAATRAVSQGEELINRFSSAAAQAGFPQATDSMNGLAQGVLNIGSALGGSVRSTNTAAISEMQLLADEIADWMMASLVPEVPQALPPPR